MATKKSVKYRGFIIKPTHFNEPFNIDGGWVHDGFIVVSKGCNPMPGAAWFQTVGEAKFAIRVLLMAGYMHGFIDSDGRQANRFWAILDIIQGRHDRAILSVKQLVLSDPDVVSVVLQIKNKDGSVTG